MGENEWINLENVEQAFKDFKGNAPFDHCVVDDFLKPEVATRLANEFPAYDSSVWYFYNNQIENKKALNDWNAYPETTYRFFSYLISEEFVQELSRLAGVHFYADHGLHGGGWHIHGVGGNLNPHLDYSIHPKLKLQRKLNIIVYISKELQESHGGHLGLWEAAEGQEPLGRLVKEVAPKFNRAVIFDTTQNSWHGMSRPLAVPDGVYRKSLAVYYLCEPPAAVDTRQRALFAARENQKGNAEVEDLIRRRADDQLASSAWRK